MIHNKANREEFHLIAAGDRMKIWWPSAGRHVWVTVLAVELEVTARHDGTHFITGAQFAIYNPHSYVYQADGSQKRVKRVAILHARRYSEDVKDAYTPDVATLTSEEHGALLGYLRAHGGPEGNAVVPDEVVG